MDWFARLAASIGSPTTGRYNVDLAVDEIGADISAKFVVF